MPPQPTPLNGYIQSYPVNSHINLYNLYTHLKGKANMLDVQVSLVARATSENVWHRFSWFWDSTCELEIERNFGSRLTWVIMVFVWLLLSKSMCPYYSTLNLTCSPQKSLLIASWNLGEYVVFHTKRKKVVLPGGHRGIDQRGWDLWDVMNVTNFVVEV